MYDNIPDAGTTTESVTDSEESASEITLEEIEWSIRSLKNGKAVGIDSVSAEMIKSGGTCVRDAFLSLCNLCWRTGKVPKDWRRAVIVPLYKGKGSRMECASYRAISLISTASKVYAKIIEKRMRVVSDGLLWDAQGGFRNGRGCMDQVFSLRNIVEKQLAMGRKVFCGFVDLEKAFDRVVRKDLWDILPRYGINGQLMRAVQSTYEGCMACVRLDGSLSPWFDVNIGVRQGCVLSALLFILYLDDCLQRIRLMDVGVRMSDLVVSTLLYADDVCAFLYRYVTVYNKEFYLLISYVLNVLYYLLSTPPLSCFNISLSLGGCLEEIALSDKAAVCLTFIYIYIYIYIYCCSLLSLKLENGWTDLANFAFELFLVSYNVILLYNIVIQQIMLQYNIFDKGDIHTYICMYLCISAILLPFSPHHLHRQCPSKFIKLGWRHFGIRVNFKESAKSHYSKIITFKFIYFHVLKIL
ncbi:hypothetical protein K1T71_010977 [Dendrolimus kikuchii]|uniref:Uncharacterized protein n=1 Tax=Dendrolimus kikuchii TaxID=765133 RepID=A0ACC1CQE6_9NEOP|nr:hypothetical protein K1T71_010977 [Dendrolimus kikuchii]